MRNLNLRRNHIEDLSTLANIKLDNLKRLNLSSNKIKSIKDLEYIHMINLEILDLEVIIYQIFQYLKKLIMNI